MIDKDQHLLWEAYVAEKKADKDYDGDGEVESSEDEYQGSKDKAIKKDMNKEAHDAEHDEENEDKDVQEEMDTLQFSAQNRENPEELVFKAVVSWMTADSEGLVTPEDMEGYSMSQAFDDAKDFIKDVLQDISYSEVKAYMNNTVSLGYDEEETFMADDNDVRISDTSRNDMPPREPGV